MMGGGNLFIERSLEAALAFFKDAIFSDEISGKKGVLQRLRPKTRVVSLLMLLLTACIVGDLYKLVLLYAGSVILAYFSGVRVGYFLKRVWFFIPIFAVIIALPAVFISGKYVAALFVMRVATCVSFAVLVTMTTRHSELIMTLRSFGVPGVFLEVLDMSYRYLFLFVKVFEEMHIALKARLVSNSGGTHARGWIGGRISYLFKRSMRMSEAVYLAMIARGYTGEAKKHGR